jgi:hypothetical protein
MIFEMLRWWYGTGWLQALKRISTWPQSIERAFSIMILLKTLFAPWRRIITAGGKSLDAKMHAALDNLVSRLIGSVVRTGALLAAGVATFAAFLSAIIIAIVWPFMPVLIVVFIVKGITG